MLIVYSAGGRGRAGLLDQRPARRHLGTAFVARRAFLQDGHEYRLLSMAVAVIFEWSRPLRSGRARGWAHRPFIGSFVALLGGIAAGIAVWVLPNGANPLA